LALRIEVCSLARASTAAGGNRRRLPGLIAVARLPSEQREVWARVGDVLTACWQARRRSWRCHGRTDPVAAGVRELHVCGPWPGRLPPPRSASSSLRNCGCRIERGQELFVRHQPVGWGRRGGTSSSPSSPRGTACGSTLDDHVVQLPGLRRSQQRSVVVGIRGAYCCRSQFRPTHRMASLQRPLNHLADLDPAMSTTGPGPGDRPGRCRSRALSAIDRCRISHAICQDTAARVDSGSRDREQAGDDQGPAMAMTSARCAPQGSSHGYAAGSGRSPSGGRGRSVGGSGLFWQATSVLKAARTGVTGHRSRCCGARGRAVPEWLLVGASPPGMEARRLAPRTAGGTVRPARRSAATGPVAVEAWLSPA